MPGGDARLRGRSGAHGRGAPPGLAAARRRPGCRVIVYADRYHSIIGLPRETGGDEEWAFGERIRYYEEKDRDFLANKEYFLFVTDALRALFWPNRGVIEITRSEKAYPARNPESKISSWEIPVSAEGLERMRAWLNCTLGSPTALLDDGWQIYYPSARRYHFLYTCHHFVAQALREGGVPVQPRRCLLPSGLWRQLNRLGRPK